MTETDWNEATDPEPLLSFLLLNETCSGRKLRLFVVACCMRLVKYLPPVGTHGHLDTARKAVELAERYADGNASEEDRIAAVGQAQAAAQTTPEHFVFAEVAATTVDAVPDAVRVSEAAALELTFLEPADELWDPGQVHPAWESERAAQTQLLRDLFGPLPFRSIPIEPTWLTPTVLGLAQCAYDHRDFSLMPALGTALSDAGCTDPEILAHCVSQIHCRGCWLIDLILGKE